MTNVFVYASHVDYADGFDALNGAFTELTRQVEQLEAEHREVMVTSHAHTLTWVPFAGTRDGRACPGWLATASASVDCLRNDALPPTDPWHTHHPGEEHP